MHLVDGSERAAKCIGKLAISGPQGPERRVCSDRWRRREGGGPGVSSGKIQSAEDLGFLGPEASCHYDPAEVSCLLLRAWPPEGLPVCLKNAPLGCSLSLPRHILLSSFAGPPSKLFDSRQHGLTFRVLRREWLRKLCFPNLWKSWESAPWKTSPSVRQRQLSAQLRTRCFAPASSMFWLVV